MQGKRAAFSNLVSSAGTKGTGTNLSSVIYGNWSELFMGIWSEIDLLTNPFESVAYSKGNVQIWAMMTVDIAVRYAASFAAIRTWSPNVTAARNPDGTELRAAPAAELRAGSGRTLAGYAAVWDSPARIGGVFDELVRRGAFTASLASRADVFLLAHHDFSQPLARTGNASLQLREDARGLAFEAALPETRSTDDVLALARSGTLAGASFAFRVPGRRRPLADPR